MVESRGLYNKINEQTHVLDPFRFRTLAQLKTSCQWCYRDDLNVGGFTANTDIE